MNNELQLNLAERWDAAKLALSREEFDLAVTMTAGIDDELFAASDITFVGTVSPKKSAPIASIVVLSQSDSDLVTRALALIADQYDERFELILVNNGNQHLGENAAKLFPNFWVITPPFPLDCSTGRNIAARQSSAECIIFLDDDGMIGPGTLDAFLAARNETGASMIRGRVFPLTQSRDEAPSHYDLGETRKSNFLNAEGISCVDRKLFVEFGGFPNLAAGHEGVELSARMWPFLGAFGFLYEPKAILLHDYTKDDLHSAEKVARFALMKNYVLHRTPEAFNLRDIVRKANLPLLPYYARSSGKSSTPVSIITTARNGITFVGDYTKSFKLQDHDNFEIVFVDDGSTDGTAEEVAALWEGDRRFRLIRSDKIGRSAALNLARSTANHDILLIADVDDISVPRRLSWTVAYFDEDPDLEVLSFATFNENNMLCTGGRPMLRTGGWPKMFLATDLATRLLFGMAGQFPTYAFRTKLMREPFDTNLTAGVDYDWVARNMLRKNGLKGFIVPVPAIFYREHSGSITATRQLEQNTVKSKTIELVFRFLLGELSDKDSENIGLALGGRMDTSVHGSEFSIWRDRLLSANARRRVFSPLALHNVLDAGQSAIFLNPKQATDSIKELRTKAQIHVDREEYKDARHILRALRRIGGSRGLTLQLLAAARQKVVRKVFSVYRYRG